MCRVAEQLVLAEPFASGERVDVILANVQTDLREAFRDFEVVVDDERDICVLESRDQPFKVLCVSGDVYVFCTQLHDVGTACDEGEGGGFEVLWGDE